MNMKVYDMTHADKVIVEHPICPPLLARMGTGGNQVPLVLGSAQANAAILSDGTCPTLTAQMGTGGNNMPLVLTQNQVGEIRCSETVAPTLTGQANASARNHPLVLAVHENQLSECRLSEMCPPLQTPSGKAGRGLPVVLQEAYRISSDESGGALPHVFKLRSGCDGGGKGYLGQDDKSFTLATNNDQYLMTAETYCLAENTIGRQPHNGGNGNGWQKDLSYTLNATGVHGVKTEARVRKLTPIECERLQGFPDNYTRIPWKGKGAEECPDSPRYKAIGNSWAVPCVRWIGKRIQDELEKNK